MPPPRSHGQSAQDPAIEDPAPQDPAPALQNPATHSPIVAIPRAFDHCADVTDVASTMLDQALALTGAARGNVQLIEWGQNPTLEIAAHHGFHEEFLEAFRSVSAGFQSACARALITREVVLIDDVLEDAQFAPYRDLALRAGFRSVQSTPMISTGGGFYGVVSTHAEQTGRPDDRLVAALRTAARQAADAIASLRARGAAAAMGPRGAQLA